MTTNTSVLTSIGNDYGYPQLFARQIQGIGKAGDVALGISTSGKSSNVLAGLEVARQQRMTSVALTGRDVMAIENLADVLIRVPSDDTPRVQEVHRTVLHIICALVEDTLRPS